jgi:phosphopantetheinyl transferase (holo-ACP synthase)
MNIVTLPESWRGRALVISEVGDPESFLTPEERATVKSYPRAKRQMEWMLSRIAEKELRRRGARGEQVSFSHSAGYGAAAIDVNPIGIDVQVVRQISEGAAHHFLMDDEIESMNGCTIAHRLLHFWCAKEAVWKQQRGAVATLKRVPIQLIGQREKGLRFENVETFFTRDLVAALTLPTS